MLRKMHTIQAILSGSLKNFSKFWRSLTPKQRWDILCNQGMSILGTPGAIQSLPGPIQEFLIGAANSGVS